MPPGGRDPRRLSPPSAYLQSLYLVPLRPQVGEFLAGTVVPELRRLATAAAGRAAAAGRRVEELEAKVAEVGVAGCGEGEDNKGIRRQA